MSDPDARLTRGSPPLTHPVVRNVQGGVVEPSQLLKGVLDLAVLAVIDRADGYGYEVVRGLRAAGLQEVGDASVYGTPRRLYNAGLLTSYVVPSDEGPHAGTTASTRRARTGCVRRRRPGVRSQRRWKGWWGSHDAGRRERGREHEYRGGGSVGGPGTGVPRRAAPGTGRSAGVGGRRDPRRRRRARLGTPSRPTRRSSAWPGTRPARRRPWPCPGASRRGWRWRGSSASRSSWSAWCSPAAQRDSCWSRPSRCWPYRRCYAGDRGWRP